ncbi:hypothetical protein [Brevibacillus reuszeri]|uniref:hypothetical protein n=1 Tax=Brevibacillus reuszeri TaxID=54915 RepID=UPI000CCC5C52|nr:hypothetical protein [Brevibacillus reuszeri]
MYGIISSPDFIDEIKKAIENETIIFEESGKFSADAFVQHCQSVSAAQIHTLIVDINATDDLGMIKGIRTIRMKRKSRIIVVAPGREPGDLTINTLLKFQVFDFVAPSLSSIEGYEDDEDDEDDEELLQRKPLSIYIQEQLKKEASYANAARWDVGSEEIILKQMQEQTKTKSAEGTKTPKETQKSRSGIEGIEQIEELEINPPAIREKQTLVETIIGTVIIAVVGVEPTAGSTHTAILIADFLSRKGRNVSIIEANNSDDFSRIANAYDGLAGVPNDEQFFTIEGVDYYKSNYRYDVPELLEMSYDYIVLDLGSYRDTVYMEEFYRAHVQVVVGHGIEWRQGKVYEFANEHRHRDQSKWIYCIPTVNKLIQSDVQKGLGTGIVHVIPQHPDPYKSQRDTDNVLETFLKEYMGQKRKKTSTRVYMAAIILLSVIVIMLFIILYLKN